MCASFRICNSDRGASGVASDSSLRIRNRGRPVGALRTMVLGARATPSLKLQDRNELYYIVLHNIHTRMFDMPRVACYGMPHEQDGNRGASPRTGDQEGLGGRR